MPRDTVLANRCIASSRFIPANMTTYQQNGIAIALLLASLAGPARSQFPDKFENLQALPKDIQRDSLIQIMRGFSFALGVRCQYCHTGGDGVSFAGVSFKADEKTSKQNARFMIR